MLEPTFGEFAGLPALERLAAEAGSWPEAVEDWQWCARFAYQVIERRGTGGGCFRLMYSRFLEEAGREEAPLAAAAAARWTELAEAFRLASESDEPRPELGRGRRGAERVLAPRIGSGLPFRSKREGRVPVRPCGGQGYLGHMTIGASIFLIAVGAILKFATNFHVSGLSIDTVGLILMIAGAAGLVLGLIQASDLVTPPPDEVVAPAVEERREVRDPALRGHSHEGSGGRLVEAIRGELIAALKSHSREVEDELVARLRGADLGLELDAEDLAWSARLRRKSRRGPLPR